MERLTNMMRGLRGKDWFEVLMGFEEDSYAQAKSQMEIVQGSS